MLKSLSEIVLYSFLGKIRTTQFKAEMVAPKTCLEIGHPQGQSKCHLMSLFDSQIDSSTISVERVEMDCTSRSVISIDKSLEGITEVTHSFLSN